VSSGQSSSDQPTPTDTPSPDAPKRQLKTKENRDSGVSVEDGLGSRELSNWELIRRMLGYAWQYKRSAVGVVVLQLILLGFALWGLGLIGLGIDVIRWELAVRGTEGLGGAKPPQYPLGIGPPQQWPAMGKVAAIAAGVLAIALVRFIFDRTATVANARLVQQMIVDLRSQVFDKLQRLSFRFYDANESGSIINRVTGDVQAVRIFVDGVIIQVVMMAVSLAFFLVYMVSIHPLLTLACLGTTPLLWLVTTWFSRVVRPAYIENRKLYDGAIRTLSENVQGVHVVKGFSLQDNENEKFAQANDRVTRQQRWIFSRVAIFTPVISFIPHLNTVILLLYGGWLVMRFEQAPTAEAAYASGISLGQMLVFAGLLGQFSGQVGNVAQLANFMQRSLTGAQRVFEVLDTPVEIQSPPDPVPLKRARGAVAFHGVHFEYDREKPVLEDVNFEAKPGECVAILGATGCGKSTLLSLIPRFYDPRVGRVLVDGLDVREYDLDDLRRQIGIVFQESYLFSNTVANNIAFGHPKATREQIERAATIAQAHDFIMEDLANGYDTYLAEAGANLSGGQRQRLAIARAVLLDPPILLLDDPTAAIDPETEHQILEAMNAAMSGRTTFVVAHRLSTMRRANQVLVFEHGKLVQQGTHQQLMQTQGHYRRAARLQLADDESRRLLGLGGVA